MTLLRQKTRGKEFISVASRNAQRKRSLRSSSAVREMGMKVPAVTGIRPESLKRIDSLLIGIPHDLALGSAKSWETRMEARYRY